MTDSLTHVKGLKELTGFLTKLPEKVQNNILRGALRAGAKVVQEEAKRNAPVDTGKLRDGIKVGSRKKGGIVTASVKTTGPHGFLANWMEFGVAAHTIVAEKGGFLFVDNDTFAQSVEHPGLQPKPFMRPALEGKATEATVATGNYMKSRMTKAGIEGASEVDIEPEEAP